MGRKMKRIEIRERIQELSAYDLIDGCSIESIIEDLKKIQDEHSSYDSLYIDVESYGYDGAYELVLYGKRIESDSEYERRVAEIKKQREKQKALKEAKKEKEYQEYIRLKEKFEEA